jgi:hypothetical protein
MGANMLKLEDVKELLETSDEEVLSIYLNVDNTERDNQAVSPAWRTWLKNSLQTLNNQPSDQKSEAWPQITERLEAYLNDYTPSSKALAMFYGKDFEKTFDLPIKVENQIRLGKKASVGALLWMLDEFEPYLVLLVDQKEARFFVSYLGSVDFRDTIEMEADTQEWFERTIMSNPIPGDVPGAVHGGSGRDDFDNRMDEHIGRMYRETARHLEDLLKRHDARRIILAGVEESAHAVYSQLPEKVQEKVVSIQAIPLRSTTAEIQERILPSALSYERHEELALVNNVIDLAKAGDRGALGHKAVHEALIMQRVELLILPWPMEHDEEVLEKTFLSSGSVEFVHGEAAARLMQEGGIAARLYYAM